MDAESRSSGNFPSTTASIFWVFLSKPVDVDFRFLATWLILISPQGGVVASIPISTGKGAFFTLTTCPMSSGVLPSMPVLLTLHGVLLTHAPPGAASATTSFVAGVNSVSIASVAPLKSAQSSGQSSGLILGWRQGESGYSIFLFRITVASICNFLLPLLVWITVSGLCVRSPCASLAVAVSDF